MSEVLTHWNQLPEKDATDEILPCCGSKAWARQMSAARPLTDEESLLVACDAAWSQLSEPDWMEAFDSHPRIGERAAPLSTVPSAQWSAQEQRGLAGADAAVKVALAEGNRQYEQQFNRTFIVCATGKSAAEILQILLWRLQNDEATELREAVEQLCQITHIRLKKWLQG